MTTVINELRSGKYKLSSAEFEKVWTEFDISKYGAGSDCKISGKVKVDDTEDLVRRCLTNVNVKSFSPYQEALSELLTNTLEPYILICDVIALFPVPADIFVRYFSTLTSSQETPSVVFMKLWREFDTDQKGYLDIAEIGSLVEKVLETAYRKLEQGFGLNERKFEPSKKEVKKFVERLIEEGDRNNDGKIQLWELARLLNVEQNFLDICPQKLQQKELGDIFRHYDHDDSGAVEGAEFLAFVRDVLRIDEQPLSRFTRKETDIDAEELELAGSMIMGLVDENNDGKLDKKELGVVMEKRKRKLIKNQTTFIRMQESFDKGEF